MSVRAIITLLLCGLCACASSGGSAPGPDPAAGLPPSALSALPSPAGLDALHGAAASASAFRGYGAAEFVRGASALVNSTIPLDPPFLSSHTQFIGPSLVFNHQNAEPVWAIYRISPPGGVPVSDLLSIVASGHSNTTGLWLVVADYSSGRWEQASKLVPTIDSSATISLSSIGNPISPDGYLYCALVVPANSNDGAPAVLESLTFSYDDGLPSGPVYYVAPPADGGDDGNDGGASSPWATLQHAADTVIAGDTVIVRPGDYGGFMLQSSGSPGSPISFSAENGARVISDNGNTPDGINIENWDGPPGIHDVVIEGFTVEGATRTGIRIVGTDDDGAPGSDAGYARDILIRNTTCRANGSWGILSGHVDDLTVEGNICSESGAEHGIYLSNSADRNIARWNVCHDNNFSGIQYNADGELPGDATMSDCLLEYNIIYNNGLGNGGAALNLDGVADSLIRGNLLYNNHATGLVMYNGDGDDSQDNTVLNNTILQPADGRWCVTIGTSPGNHLFNNILLSEHSFRGAIDVDSASLGGMQSDSNIVISRFIVDDGGTLSLADWQTQYGRDLDSAVHTAAELFVNTGADDYHLKAGSPGINFGTADLDLPPLDLDELTRPQGSAIDAGAFEFDE